MEGAKQNQKGEGKHGWRRGWMMSLFELPTPFMSEARPNFGFPNVGTTVLHSLPQLV